MSISENLQALLALAGAQVKPPELVLREFLRIVQRRSILIVAAGGDL